MRLSQMYINAIKKYTYSTFGDNAKVFLFGSRVNDTLKGGNIDLYIVSNDTKDRSKIFSKKI